MPRNPLTANEKLTLLLSLLALIVSAATPIVGYYWLQDTVREQTLKAKGFRASGHYVHRYGFPDEGETLTKYFIELKNSSDLQIESVQIPVSYYGRTISIADITYVTVNPPVRYSVERPDSSSFVVFLSDPLPPGDSLTVMVAEIKAHPDSLLRIPQPNAWVRTEATPNAAVTWTFGGGYW